MADTEPVWIIYDGRALSGDTDDAAVLESFGVDDAKNDVQAIKYAKRQWRGYEFALYRYDLNTSTKPHQAGNERMIHFQEAASL